MFDWEDMRHFLALAETGTLSGAARSLKVDHATVGRRVSALEQMFDTSLIERLPKRWVLTEAGQRVAVLGQGMQTQAHALERAVKAQHSPLSGTVTLSTPPAFASYFLAPRLQGLRRLYPDLHLTLLGNKSVASLSQQEADIAVRISRPQEASSVARKIGTMEFWLYAAPGYADRPSAEWEFVAYDHTLDHVVEQKWLIAFAAGRSIVFRANDLACQAAAARAGVGIAMLPCFLSYRDPELVALSIDLERATRDIYLVVHSDLRRMPAVRAVLEFVADQVSAGMPPAGA
ncbi:LysR family transcriptional regulator [Lichenicola cladoniae]|uniref:LysR family transcriptional regulator n=1 Tax=Lichenicola cladoniae TaxID=1484109 RepID=A0A6M8HUW5_9PROT|nr:LysR family transcriptional regulator [Lichenicola cladoniae]NPD66103.1 LysR family transcriptional regulator [Acetobacteraceae bacterium]QKE91975.1 LysR family transcriptional regulator [Lichenicola cladoniae]